MDNLQPAQFAAVDQHFQIERGGFKVLAISDHQAHVVGAAGVDHLLALGDAGGHGLFAKHVFAGGRRLHGELRVRAVVGGNVNRLHLRMFQALRVGCRNGRRRWRQTSSPGAAPCVRRRSPTPPVGLCGCCGNRATPRVQQNALVPPPHTRLDPKLPCWFSLPQRYRQDFPSIIKRLSSWSEVRSDLSVQPPFSGGQMPADAMGYA